MGKASKWFRGLLGLIKPDNSPSPKPPKEKRRWSFVKSYREKDHHHTTVDHHHATTSYGDRHVEGATDPDKHAVAVATTTAGGIVREEWAAVKIQAAFRGCLARKALRALKGLVKLQALVRGHVERKRTAEWLQRMQALLLAQARARAARAQILHASYWAAKPSTAHLHGPATPEKFESPIRSVSMKYDHSSPLLKRNGSKSRVHINGNQDKYGNRSDSRVDEQQSWNQRKSWIRTCSMDDETSVKILEIDSGKPHITSKRRNLFSSTSQPLVWDQYYSQSLTTTKDSTSYQSGQLQSPSSCEVRSYSPLKINQDEENSPQILSTSSKDGGSKRSAFTPSKKSDGSRSYLSGYSDYPSYMAYTESSKAKVRSMSAPKQRPHYERSTSLTSKDNPASGRLDKLGLPVGYSY